MFKAVRLCKTGEREERERVCVCAHACVHACVSVSVCVLVDFIRYIFFFFSDSIFLFLVLT